jgi:protein TonB
MEIIIIIALIIAGISLYEYFTARRWQQVTSNDRNDIVFADRNKEYGAFVLRTGYDRTMSIILFSVFASFALAFGIYKFVKNLPEDEVKGPKVEMIKKTIQTSKKEDTPPPPPPPPAPPPGPKVVANPPPVIVDEEVNDPVKTQDQVENVNTGAKDNEGNDDNWGAIPDTPGNGTGDVIPQAETIEDFVDEEPEFPGGMDAFYAWVTRNTEFPDGSDGGEITAEVVLSKDGKINDVRILNSSAPELDRVVKKTLLQSSKWKPGRSNGKPVNYRFVIPFRFQL